MALYKLEFAILTPDKQHCGVYQEGFTSTVAPVLSGHLWDNAKLAAKDRWPLIPGFKLMGKKHRVFSFWLYCTDL